MGFGAAKSAADAMQRTHVERVSWTTPPAALKMARWCVGTVPMDSEESDAMCVKLVLQGRIVMHVNRATILRVVLTSVKPSATAKQRVTGGVIATGMENVPAMPDGTVTTAVAVSLLYLKD